MASRILILPVMVFLLMDCGKKQLDPSQFAWQPVDVGSSSSLRGIDVLNKDEIWISGSNGFCAKTVNSGTSWQRIPISGSDSADFRDIHVFENGVVYLMSIGSGEMSKIYKTEDAGENWVIQLQNPFKQGFFSSMAFWDEQHGIVLSDPVDGKFVFFKTVDGGNQWTQVPPQNIPPAITGEYAFAASGTCLITGGDRSVWLGTGGSVARVFKSMDQGETWQVGETPIVCGTPSSGIFSLAFKNAQNGIAVGGDYQKPDQAQANVVKTSDGGKTWQLVEDSSKMEFRSCVTILAGSDINVLIAVGRSGCDYSVDDGNTWFTFSDEGYYTLSFASSGYHGWAAGSDGRVAKFVYSK